jgi:mannose-6-phosphate isomerase-like protein (cupin superfamily)
MPSISGGKTHETAEWRWTLADAAAKIPACVPVPYATVFQHSSLSLEIYAPRERDEQLPHDQDELYVVMRGTGHFLYTGQAKQFGPGDVLFVPAGAEHRFADFTDDLLAWVVFYGPKGGERR